MNIKKLSLISAAVLTTAFAVPSQAQTTTVIVDDTLPALTSELTAGYFATSSTGGAIEIIESGTGETATTTAIGLVTGSSGRQIHALFDTVTLELGDSITASLTFETPATVSTVNNDDMRIALFDPLGRTSDTELGRNNSASTGTPNPLLVGIPGVVIEVDVENSTETDQDLEIRQSAPSITGRLLGTTSSSIPAISSSADNGFVFTANTTYRLELTVERVAGATVDDLNVTVNFFTTVNDSEVLTDSHTDTVTPTPSLEIVNGAEFIDSTDDGSNNPTLQNLADPGNITTASPEPSYSFGMFGLGASSGAFGSSNSVGDADNGLEILSFSVSVVDADGIDDSEPPVEEPTDEEICVPVTGSNGNTTVFCI